MQKTRPDSIRRSRRITVDRVLYGVTMLTAVQQLAVRIRYRMVWYSTLYYLLAQLVLTLLLPWTF